MVTQKAIVYLILMLVSSPQVSSQDSSCHQDCTLVNIAREAVSRLTSRDNNPPNITGQASWVTDGETSGPCASVSSFYPAWEAEFGQNRTVTRLKIFWKGPQDDVYVSVGSRRCHTPRNSTDQWESEYTLDCDVPVTGKRLLIYREPSTDARMLNLSLCEVEIYADPIPTSSSMSTSTTAPATFKTVSTPSVTTSSVASSTPSTVSGTSMGDSTTTVTKSSVPSSTPSSVSEVSMGDSTSLSSLSSTQPPIPSGVMSSTVESTTTTSTTTAKLTTSPQTSIVTSTAEPLPTKTSTTSHAKPTTQPSGADTGTLIGAIVGVVVLLLIIVVMVVVCRNGIKKKYIPKDAEAKEAERSQAIKMDDVEQPNSTVLDLNEFKSVTLPTYPEEKPASMNGSLLCHIPCAVSVANLPSYIREKLDAVITTEYAMIPAGLRNTHTYETAQREENLHKNRYNKLFAYDDTRVPLQNEGGADYINASYIHGFKSPLKFIAAQGPLNSTVVDFWTMVWQQGSREIVMLTNLLEDGVHKCHMYWLGKGERGSYGNITVTQEKSIERAHYTVRVFSLHHRKKGTRREVTQYHYTSWPDHGVPTAPSLVSFWRHVSICSKPIDGQAGPIIVHCSAGVGRTGTYIGLDILMNEALVEEKVNFFIAVLNMREQRLNMVQTQGQYKFLHWAVLEALFSRETPVVARDLPAMLEADSIAIQEEYENLEVMMSLQGDPKTYAKPDPTEEDDDELFNFNITPLPSYFNKKGFLNIGVVKEPSPEELWQLVCRNSSSIIITISENPSDAMPNDVGTSLTFGEFHVTLNSVDDVSVGVTERKLTIESKTLQTFWDSGSGVASIVNYNLHSPSTERLTDKASLLMLVELLTERQHISGPRPVILQCREAPEKCSLFAAAVNVLTSLRLDKEVDIYLAVREIQCRKGQPITCVEDYRYLYELVTQQVQSSNTFATN